MKKQDLKGKNAEELMGMVRDLKKEQFNLRFQAAAGELTNMSRFKEVRRTIARIFTQLNTQKKG